MKLSFIEWIFLLFLTYSAINNNVVADAFVLTNEIPIIQRL